jgi:hypothetical protein
MLGRSWSWFIRTAWILLVPFLLASDHADPIDPFNKKRLEGGITDLFVFPVKQDGKVAFPFTPRDAISLAKPNLKPRDELNEKEQSEIKGLVVVLCVRRALTQRGSLQLEPFTYRIHFDQYTPVAIVDPAESYGGRGPAGSGGGYQPSPGPKKELSIQEARARYGGRVSNPEGINPDVTIEIRLKNDATLNGDPKITGLRNVDKVTVYNGSVSELKDTDSVIVHTGVHDDPFIFPAFFGTNVVAMVMHIPIAAFAENKTEFLIWATSHEGDKQIDHVGRSLRTQNPRFEILNTIPPKEHVAAIMNADKNPSLLRDLGLRFTVQQIAAYRSWDFVPDVMIYSKRYPVGFPNGRFLSDDVAALLAQHGDTLLFELSHQHPNGGWPRRTTNDKPFLKTTEDRPEDAEFPYLAEPWPDKAPAPPLALKPNNRAKLAGLAAAIVVVLVAIGFLLARWYWVKRLRPRYL